MRINRYIAMATGMSRRAADKAVGAGQVTINNRVALLGDEVGTEDKIKLKGKLLSVAHPTIIMLNKPVGYVSSREGQGSKTIYELLPKEHRDLKPVGRLDKDSSGLLLLTNDGKLAYELTHPKFNKEKVYRVELDKALDTNDRVKIEQGVQLEDGDSQLKLYGQGSHWTVKISEGRNRQIRRTFDALGYKVRFLHRTKFGQYSLNNLRSGKYIIIED